MLSVCACGAYLPARFPPTWNAWDGRDRPAMSPTLSKKCFPGLSASTSTLTLPIACCLRSAWSVIPRQTPDALGQWLDFLVSAGLSTPGKARALRSWTGLAHERLSPDSWPSDLRSVSSLLAGRMQSTFLRWIHHVKIVFEPEKGMHAKAYLGVKHHWLTSEELRRIIDALPEKE